MARAGAPCTSPGSRLGYPSLMTPLKLARTLATSLLLTAPVLAGGAPRIMIDPGHGGADPGAVANGLAESEVNLDVSLRLRALLEADSLDPAGGGTWDVRMTREVDAGVSLAQRVSMANSWPADRFYSIHHNAFTSPAANGTETFSFANGTVAADLRDKSQEELLAALGLTDRGVKTANFFVLVNTTMPAILSEGGFLTSPVDSAVLSDPQQLQRAAEAHLYALQRHFGHAPYLPTVAPRVYCEPKLTSGGCLPAIGAVGAPSLTGGVTVRCQQVTGAVFGMLFWSQVPADAPFFGGRLCVAAPQTRTTPAFSGGPAGPNCQGNLQTTLTPVYLASQGLGVGDVLYAQWWFRDPHLPADRVGLSAGLELLLQP